MARILFVHIRYPEFDRCSGDVRVTNMLRILSANHEVALHVLHQPIGYLAAIDNQPYADLLTSFGVRTVSGSLVRHLRRERYDAIVIEFWYIAAPIIQVIRTLQPQARVIVDTEHIYFYSDQVRQDKLGSGDTVEIRTQRKQAELATYRRADAILTTTDEDRDVVLAEDNSIVCRTIPNIHELPDAPVGQLQGRRANSVIFVGNFRNNPSNADAMLWFCAEIMPRLRRRVPDATLRIVGNMPPVEITDLACGHVEVTGYVPETAPYLGSSMVSVCPLRFGAGLKGKIGEAMVHGLPVVSTAVGTQGMQPLVGEEILVADSPEEFASAIAKLIEDAALWTRLSRNGRDFIDRNFGFVAVERRLDATFGDLSWLSVQPQSVGSRVTRSVWMRARDMLKEHVLWRLQP